MIFIAPHSDDEILFGAYTIMRKKPLVVIVTNSTLQGNNGEERVLESYKAMRMLGANVCFLGIDEDKLNEEILIEKLGQFRSDEIVYIPEIEENGNPHHNLISEVCEKMFWNIRKYKTYTGTEMRTIGKEIIPTKEEKELKLKAMQCYQTQIKNPMTSHYFLTTKEYE